MKIELPMAQETTPRNLNIYYDMFNWLGKRDVEYEFTWIDHGLRIPSHVNIPNGQDALAFKLQFVI